MAFGSLSDSDAGDDLAEINMIPLIDVMLVLLVIFIVTAPLLTHAVKVDLPRASSSPNLTQPDNVQLAIDGRSQVYWNGEAVDAAALAERICRRRAGTATRAAPARRSRHPLRKGGAGHVRSRAHGLTRIGFVTDPSMNR
ncbi:MAG: biopolymer transporter ExbD [Rhodocyclaceae bacterium]|nr:biopolymer transporter ExbD [Rhodocyclaceae bacterium]